MITITIDVSNATQEEKDNLNSLYSKPINSLSKDVTFFYKDDSIKKTVGSGLGINHLLIFQSMEDLK